MGWKVDKFIRDSYVFLVNFKKSDLIGNFYYAYDGRVKFDGFNKNDVDKVFRILKIRTDVNTLLNSILLNVAYGLLNREKVIVIDSLFSKLIYEQVDYYIRLFRLLGTKKNINFLFLDNEMNVICEYAKKFFLKINDNEFILVDDFFDDFVYTYVKMPLTVKTIKYLESKGHIIDHEITYSELLKAIYRGVL